MIKSKAESIGILAHRIAEGLFAKKCKSALVGRLILHWPSIVGEAMAKETRPFKASLSEGQEGMLTILVSEKEALAISFHTEKVLTLVNTFMGYRAFGRLVFRRGLIDKTS